MSTDTLTQAVFFIVLIVLMLVPWLLLPAPWCWLWMGTFGSIVAAVIAWEIAAKLKTRRTLSQGFWKWSKEHVVKACIVLASLALAGASVLWHLACKMVQRKKEST